MKLLFTKLKSSQKGFTHPPNSRDLDRNNSSGDVRKKLNLVGGFTLVETLVAVAIFAIAITGLIAITASGVQNTNFVKNKFTAGYLALEGMELVHNIRDTYAINGSGSWNQMLADLNVCTIACFVDAADLVPMPCYYIDNCPFMTFEDDTGRFSYHPIDGINNLRTIFVRTITIEQISTSEIKVVSSVAWGQGSGAHSVSYTSNLFNWVNP